MKLARVGARGQERPVAIDENGHIRDLSGLVDDIRAEEVERILTAELGALPVLDGDVRFGVPVSGVSKVVAIGLNYREHAEEANLPIPEEPVVFMKSVGCLAGAHDDVPLPRGSSMMDWEVELGVVIGKRARYVDPDAALRHVAGYLLVNDLSERQDQMQRGGTWDKGKSHDGFGPVGPWLVTQDELGDAADVPLVARVNGRVMQRGSTSDMIFGVSEIVAYVSRFMTLEPGDIIATGTPAGVGIGQSPEPIFLKVGDLVELDGGPLGNQRQQIVASI